MDADKTLATLCAQHGDRVCSYGNMIRRTAAARYDYRTTDTEWRHLGQVAVFEAFLELGGDCDSPERFDWASASLVRKAVSLLQKMCIGSHSDIYDYILRGRVRLAGAHNEELQWDSWRDATVTDAAGDRDLVNGQADLGLHAQAQTGSQRYYDFDSRAHRAPINEEIVFQLTSLLRPQEAVWLIRRYRDGEPTAAIARELVEKEPRYQAADGFTRASRYVDVVVHRAKKKARSLLEPQWGQLAQEVA